MLVQDECLCSVHLGGEAVSRIFYAIKCQGFPVNHHKKRHCVQPSKDSFQSTQVLFFFMRVILALMK